MTKEKEENDEYVAEVESIFGVSAGYYGYYGHSKGLYVIYGKLRGYAEENPELKTYVALFEHPGASMTDAMIFLKAYETGMARLKSLPNEETKLSQTKEKLMEIQMMIQEVSDKMIKIYDEIEMEFMENRVRSLDGASSEALSLTQASRSLQIITKLLLKGCSEIVNQKPMRLVS